MCSFQEMNNITITQLKPFMNENKKVSEKLHHSLGEKSKQNTNTSAV